MVHIMFILMVSILYMLVVYRDDMSLLENTGGVWSTVADLEI